jgi:hypothetical protein
MQPENQTADIARLIEAFGRGLAQGLVGARAVTTLKAKQRKTRSKKITQQPVQEDLFPMPTFGREELEISPEQLAQRMQEFEAEMAVDKTIRRPSPPPPKDFPGDDKFPKVDADTYQPSREDDTEGRSTGIPWRS